MCAAVCVCWCVCAGVYLSPSHPVLSFWEAGLGPLGAPMLPALIFPFQLDAVSSRDLSPSASTRYSAAFVPLHHRTMNTVTELHRPEGYSIRTLCSRLPCSAPPFTQRTGILGQWICLSVFPDSDSVCVCMCVSVLLNKISLAAKSSK